MPTYLARPLDLADYASLPAATAPQLEALRVSLNQPKVPLKARLAQGTLGGCAFDVDGKHTYSLWDDGGFGAIYRADSTEVIGIEIDSEPSGPDGEQDDRVDTRWEALILSQTALRARRVTLPRPSALSKARALALGRATVDEVWELFADDAHCHMLWLAGTKGRLIEADSNSVVGEVVAGHLTAAAGPAAVRAAALDAVWQAARARATRPASPTPVRKPRLWPPARRKQ